MSTVTEEWCLLQETSAKRDGAAAAGGSPIPESHPVFHGEGSGHDPTAQQRPLSAQVCLLMLAGCSDADDDDQGRMAKGRFAPEYR